MSVLPIRALLAWPAWPGVFMRSARRLPLEKQAKGRHFGILMRKNYNLMRLPHPHLSNATHSRKKMI
jgi:hypothetical protein